MATSKQLAAQQAAQAKKAAAQQAAQAKRNAEVQKKAAIRQAAQAKKDAAAKKKIDDAQAKKVTRTTQDISAYTEGYRQALPSVVDIENQYRPQFGAANIADIGQYQQGLQALQGTATGTAQQQLQDAQRASISGMTDLAGGARGLLQTISPEGASLVGQSMAGAQSAQQYANQFGQAAQQAYGQYAPDTSRLTQTVADYSPVGMPSQTISQYTGPSVPSQNISSYSPMGTPSQTIIGGDKRFGNLSPNVQQFQLDTSGITGLAQKAYQTADTLSPEQMRAAQQTAREAGMSSGRVGGTGTIAAEILNREAAKAGRRSEAAQLGAQAFQQQSSAAQIQQANQQALFAQRQAQVGQRQSQAEFNLQRQQAQFGQGAQQTQLGMQQAEQLRATQQAQFEQGAQQAQIQMQSAEQQRANEQAKFSQGTQLTQLGMQQAEQARATQQAQFGQQATAMEQQRAAQAQGFNQFSLLGQQQLQAQEAARMANQQAYGQQQSFYTQPAFGLLGSTPQSYTAGQQFTQYGIGLLGQSTPQMINPDTGVNLGAAERQDANNLKMANTQADASKSAGMMGGIGAAAGGAIVGAALI